MAASRVYGDELLMEPFIDRLGRARTVGRALNSALGWIVRRLEDPAGSGFLWVRRMSPTGILNQVWEDSGDSYYHEDGMFFDCSRPYAPVAVQGYAYDALLGSAELLEDRGDDRPGWPDALRAKGA